MPVADAEPPVLPDPPPLKVRVRWRRQGYHVHMRMFSKGAWLGR